MEARERERAHRLCVTFALKIKTVALLVPTPAAFYLEKKSMSFGTCTTGLVSGGWRIYYWWRMCVEERSYSVVVTFKCKGRGWRAVLGRKRLEKIDLLPRITFSTHIAQCALNSSEFSPVT